MMEGKGNVQERIKAYMIKYKFRLFLFTVLFLFFLLLGHDGPVLFDDSESYMWIRGQEGVMPVYPIFLLLNEYLFGYEWYLWAVIVEQALLAALSVVILEETMRVRFEFRLAEGALFCLFALYPYTIEMPTIMTQAILTEGIAYSLFYLFLTVLLTAVWDKRYVCLVWAFGMTFLLSAVRSQLQILFGVCGIVCFYLICTRGTRAGKRGKILRILTGVVGCIAVSMVGVFLVFGLNKGYRAVLSSENFFNRIRQEVQGSGIQKILLAEEQQRETGVSDAESSVETALLQTNFKTSQYMTLIFSRGMYEADYEDAELFQDPVLRGLYLALYEVVDTEKERYAYADKGLWMWKDIAGGIGKIGMTCFWTPSEYYIEYAPEIILSSQFGDVRASHLLTIGLTLIKAHFGRFLYHTLMLLPQAFISTIFFQFAPLYLFCHLVTAFLYLMAFGLTIWGYRDVRARKEEAEMMALVLGTNVVMVIVISLAFFGQQRYLVYNFGPFYIALYLLIRQIWRVRVQEILRSRWQKKIDA